MTIKDFFQLPYNAIKNWKTPAWLKQLLSELNDVLLQILVGAGKEYINFLKEKIMEAAQEKNWTSREKFDFVFKQAKTGFVTFGIRLKDNEINTIINYLVSLLKKQGVI